MSTHFSIWVINHDLTVKFVLSPHTCARHITDTQIELGAKCCAPCVATIPLSRHMVESVYIGHVHVNICAVISVSGLLQR